MLALARRGGSLQWPHLMWCENRQLGNLSENSSVLEAACRIKQLKFHSSVITLWKASRSPVSEWGLLVSPACFDGPENLACKCRCSRSSQEMKPWDVDAYPEGEQDAALHNWPEIREKPSPGGSLEVGKEGFCAQSAGAMACMGPCTGWTLDEGFCCVPPSQTLLSWAPLRLSPVKAAPLPMLCAQHPARLSPWRVL